VSDQPGDTERTSLPAHVDLCALRYRSLEHRMRRVEYAFYALVGLMIFGRDHLLDVLKLLAPHVVIVLLLAGVARAAPPPGADPDGALAHWYRGLKNGVGGSCCDVADCRHRPVRIGQGGYEVLVPRVGPQGTLETDGTWIAVPQDKILPNRDNPTGEPVTCWSPWLGVMCFIDGAGT
jgi:hypothetical protein